jgi:hypothetical protein
MLMISAIAATQIVLTDIALLQDLTKACAKAYPYSSQLSLRLTCFTVASIYFVGSDCSAWPSTPATAVARSPGCGNNKQANLRT